MDLTRSHFADIGWFNDLVAVGEPPAAPSRLQGNAPNPFETATDIRFTLGRGEEVELGVYDLAGRLVAELKHGPMPKGSHSIRWDGHERDGRGAPAGIYVYRLRTGAAVESRPMVLFR